MAQNLMLVMAKAMLKGKLNPGALTGLERFMLAQLTVSPASRQIPDNDGFHKLHLSDYPRRAHPA
jgi:hypothetical protein